MPRATTKKEEKKTIRVGVIGVGKIAEVRHIPEYLSNKSVEMVALADIDTVQLKEIGAKFNISSLYTDYKEMLKKERLDAVSVCTPNYLHASMTIDALNEGINVLVEKPMATSLEEADKMIEAAKKNKKILMVDHNQRLAPGHQIGKKILESGILGKVYTVRTVFGHSGPEFWSPRGKWFFSKKEAFAGVMADLGVHKVDVVRWLLGREVKRIAAFGATFEKKADVEDNGVAIMEFENGTLGILQVSWTLKPGEDNSTIFYCEKGMLKLFTDPERPVIVSLREKGDFMAGFAKGEMSFSLPPMQTNEVGGQFSSGIIDYFVDCILKNEKPFISGEEGRKAMEIVIGILRSAETGKVVELPLK
ncbi:MAG: Gfo/Idh/MocA family protein [bacterium]